MCGAVQVDANYIASTGDMVAARVKSQDDEENWILAEVVTFNGVTGKYDVDDVDADDGNELVLFLFTFFWFARQCGESNYFLALIVD